MGPREDEKSEISIDFGPHCELQEKSVKNVIQHSERENVSHEVNNMGWYFTRVKEFGELLQR